MNSTVVTILAGLAKAAVPYLQPILTSVLQKLAAELFARAKTATLPDAWKWAEPIIAKVEADLEKIVTPEAIANEVKAITAGS